LTETDRTPHLSEHRKRRDVEQLLGERGIEFRLVISYRRVRAVTPRLLLADQLSARQRSALDAAAVSGSGAVTRVPGVVWSRATGSSGTARDGEPDVSAQTPICRFWPPDKRAAINRGDQPG
jgi:hypothetical protein